MYSEKCVHLKDMASHFRWYGSETMPTVPFNRRYTYPAEANHAVKNVTKIQPRNKSTFDPRGEIVIDLPSDGFLVPGNTFLEFEVELSYTPPDGDDYSIIRFQNNIQSIFDRARIRYGASNLEDIQAYNVLTRFMTTHAGTGQTGGIDQMSVTEGVGQAAWGATGTFGDPSPDVYRFGMVNARQAYIQGISLQRAGYSDSSILPDTGANKTTFTHALLASSGWGAIPNTVGGIGGANVPITVRRRYCVPLMLGLLQQPKLIPLKFMSQFSIILNLASAEQCIFWQKGDKFTTNQAGYSVIAGANLPTFQVKEVSLVTETLHFDAEYSNQFIQGLKEGVPIKYSSFNNYRFASTASSTQTIMIPENNRSIKSVFVTQNRDPVDFTKDSGACFYNTSLSKSTLQEFQFTVGSKVYPSNPISCSTAADAVESNGGAEAYASLAKALKINGDARLSTTTDIINWAGENGIVVGGPEANFKYPSNILLLNEYDGRYVTLERDLNTGLVKLGEAESPTALSGVTAPAVYGARSYAGNWNTQQFVMAFDFETSNGLEISGLNALEQQDIRVLMRWSSPQSSGMVFNAFVHYDAMLILMENSVVRLIK